MSTPSVDQLEESIPTRLLRFVGFSAVGATGMVVDLATTTTLLTRTHYILANLCGFLLAVTWNFGGNWYFVFGQPEGSIVRQYASYVSLHFVTFGLRVAVLTLLIEALGVPVLVATLIGVAVAAVANFLGAEKILSEDIEWFSIAAALNSAAHAVYSSRARGLLKRTGLYALCYAAYMRLLGLIYRDDTITVSAGGETATLQTETDPETISILHTLEKEQPVLDEWVGLINPDDVVWDVGANLGVYGALAAQAGADPICFEPVAETANRCSTNIHDNGQTGLVLPIALGNDSAQAEIALERTDIGTQTPALDAQAIDARTYRTIDVERGVNLIPNIPAPDVIKIDVEGNETEVLLGLDDYLQELDAAIVECHSETDVVDITGILVGAGLEVEIVESGGHSYCIAR